MLPVPAVPAHGKESVQTANAHPQPVNLGSPINTAYREAEPSFTADGLTMYFNCRNGDICTSRLTGTGEQASWSTPEPLDAPINTEYEEVEPVVNATGDTLYFTSVRPIGFLKGVAFLSPFVDVLEIANRVVTGGGGQPLLGGMGLDDIWISRRINGAWSEPASINDVAGEPAVNTAYADHCLFFSADGNEAFWTSTGPGSYGADDIWTSRRVGGEWSAPENLGPNVNGPGVEHTSIPTPDGRSLYVTSDRPGGFGGGFADAFGDIFSEIFGQEILPLELIDGRFYHLDTCFCPLSGGELLYYPPAFDQYGQVTIAERISAERRLAVPEQEALRFACNSVCVGKHVVLPAGCPVTAALLESRGYQPHPVPLDEFMKSGGSAKCLTLALD